MTVFGLVFSYKLILSMILYHSGITYILIRIILRRKLAELVAIIETNRAKGKPPMTVAQILSMLQLVIPLVQSLEASGVQELTTLINGLSNATEKAALLDILTAVDTFAKAEIPKI
jgi:hypothetical protein